MCGGCGCVRPLVFCNVWLFMCAVLGCCGIYACRSQGNGCMIVVTFCCHACRDMQVRDVMLQNSLQWLRRCCMGFCFGEKAGARTFVFLRVKCMIAVTFCCHVCRDMRVKDVVLHNAL